MTEVDFYAACAEDRTYVRPTPKPKHHRQFHEEFWRPAQCQPHMSFLELGCGTGLLLFYLKEKGVKDFIGVDQEKKVLEFMPPELAEHVRIASIDDYLNSRGEKTFDRIALLDAFEHFPSIEGVALLEKLRAALTPDGRVVIRVPNMSSPWGVRHQFGDLTHKAAYTPDSIRQAAMAAGYGVKQSLPVRRGKAVKQFSQRLMESIAGKMLTESPEIWTATFVTVLAPR